MSMEQRRNDRPVTREDFAHIVTKCRELPESAVRDMFIAWITLKFTQSNSVCYVMDGQTIGVGAGQQSRVHCRAFGWLKSGPVALASTSICSCVAIQRGYQTS